MRNSDARAAAGVNSNLDTISGNLTQTLAANQAQRIAAQQAAEAAAQQQAYMAAALAAQQQPVAPTTPGTFDYSTASNAGIVDTPQLAASSGIPLGSPIVDAGFYTVPDYSASVDPNVRRLASALAGSTGGTTFQAF
jgi:hypothetical protein